MKSNLYLSGTVSPYINKGVSGYASSSNSSLDRSVNLGLIQEELPYRYAQVRLDPEVQIPVRGSGCRFYQAGPADINYRSPSYAGTTATSSQNLLKYLDLVRGSATPSSSNFSIPSEMRSQVNQSLQVSSQPVLPINRCSAVPAYPVIALPPAINNSTDWAEVERFAADSGITQYTQEKVLPFVRRRLDEEGISGNPAFIEAGNAIVSNKDIIIEKVKQNPYVNQAVTDAKSGNLLGAIVNVLASSEIEEASQEAAARAIMSGKIGVGTLFGAMRGNPRSWGEIFAATIDTMANEDTEHNRKYIKFKDPFKISFRK